VLENYRELDIEVRGRSEHCIDLISEMRKVLAYLPGITCEVDISSRCRLKNDRGRSRCSRIIASSISRFEVDRSTV
jgi:hypothetical protein